jgi:putative ABC transport system permease protein
MEKRRPESFNRQVHRGQFEYRTSIGSCGICNHKGFFIIGLTLYSSAIDRIRDYGTLKAIGATNSYITKLILIQSFMFAFLGFVIGLFLLIGFRQGVSKAGLIFTLSPVVLGGLFLITLLISVGSSFFFSIRTLNKVEPASVFRG